MHPLEKSERGVLPGEAKYRRHSDGYEVSGRGSAESRPPLVHSSYPRVPAQVLIQSSQKIIRDYEAVAAALREQVAAKEAVVDSSTEARVTLQLLEARRGALMSLSF